jgi:hypothetical protein
VAPLELYGELAKPDAVAHFGPRGSAHRGAPHGAATFELRVTLPSAVWHRLGGPPPGDSDPAPLDRRLAGLAGRPGVAARLAALQELVAYWHGPLRAEDGYPAAHLAGRPVPGPLAWWYRRGGRRTDVLNGPTRLLPPEALAVDADGRVPFLVEDQGVYVWATVASGSAGAPEDLEDPEDPPVWGRFDNAEPWVREESGLTGVLIQACLFEAVSLAPYGAFAPAVDSATLGRLTAGLREVPLGAWRWPVYPTRFWAGDGVFVVAAGADAAPGAEAGGAVHIAARTEHPLAYLREVPADWDRAAF